MQKVRNKSYPVVMLLTTAILLVCAKFLIAASKPEIQPPVQVQSLEERKFIHQAHRLGTRLFAISKRADDLALPPAERQQKLQPVYTQIEDFILQRLSDYTGRISSITVNYDSPGLQCMIFIKEGDEAELEAMKKIADSCVGRIVENLPMVQYLMIRHDEVLTAL